MSSFLLASIESFVLQLVVSLINSSRFSPAFFEKGDLDMPIGYQYSVVPFDALKECLPVSIKVLIDRLNDTLHEAMNGADYLCV